ncbi:hypothetical protein TNCV_2737021 [Trichonephila clavipes]|nr:hypothetical protein TNCV_2737021 [Trichonephila clavipes]
MSGDTTVKRGCVIVALSPQRSSDTIRTGTMIYVNVHCYLKSNKERTGVDRRQVDTEVTVIIIEAVGVSEKRSEMPSEKNHQCCGINRQLSDLIICYRYLC